MKNTLENKVATFLDAYKAEHNLSASKLLDLMETDAFLETVRLAVKAKPTATFSDAYAGYMQLLDIESKQQTANETMKTLPKIKLNAPEPKVEKQKHPATILEEQIQSALRRALNWGVARKEIEAVLTEASVSFWNSLERQAKEDFDNLEEGLRKYLARHNRNVHDTLEALRNNIG